MSSGNEQFDIAVTGGGLAGLSLAILLANKGRKVVLFEEKSYPFHKVCGEYISMESWNFLERLGVPLGEMELPLINRLRVSAPNGTLLKHTLKPGGFGVSRYLLDDTLAGIAHRAGVRLMEGNRVSDIHFKGDMHEVITSEKTYRAKVVAGTFGKRSVLDKKLDRYFIRRPMPPEYNYIGVKYHVDADLPADTIELHNFRDGYCGISRIEKGRYCMCYLTTARNLQQNQGSIEEMEKAVLMKNPFLERYFTEFKKLYEEPLVISQINFSPKSQVEDHVLMAGDAAGLITPLCGNGMSMAMHGALLVSGFINDFLDEKISRAGMEAAYTKSWKQNFSLRLKAGRNIQKLFGSSTTTNLAIGILKHFPGIVNGMVGLTHGREF
jgi:flavin-dependent dehydrogenase